MAFTPTSMEQTSKKLRELTTGKPTPSSFLQMFTILQTMLFPDAGLPEIDGFDEASMSSGSSQASSPTSSTNSQSAPHSPDQYSLRPAPPRIIPATPKTSKPGQPKSNDGDQEKDGFRTVTAKRRRDPQTGLRRKLATGQNNHRQATGPHTTTDNRHRCSLSTTSITNTHRNDDSLHTAEGENPAHHAAPQSRLPGGQEGSDAVWNQDRESEFSTASASVPKRPIIAFKSRPSPTQTFYLHTKYHYNTTCNKPN